MSIGKLAGAIDDRRFRRRSVAGDRGFCFAAELADLLQTNAQANSASRSVPHCPRLRDQSFPLCSDLRARLIGIRTHIGSLLASVQPRRRAACSPPAAA